MVEQRHGYELVDRILTTTNLTSGGIYTAVGTYPAAEMEALLQTLAAETGTSLPIWLNVFGHHLFGVFTRYYAHFLTGVSGTFDLLQQIEGYIHVEVRKLYPDAELPQFVTSRPEADTLEMLYRSERRLSDLACGLMEAAFAHYGEQASITRTPLNADESEVRFIIRQHRGV